MTGKGWQTPGRKKIEKTRFPGPAQGEDPASGAEKPEAGRLAFWGPQLPRFYLVFLKIRDRYTI